MNSAMDSEGISFGQMLDNDFGEPAEQQESLERASTSAPSQSASAPEAMQVDEGAGAPTPANQKKKKKSITPDEVKPPAKSVLYHCDYCRKDITASVRIKCAVCTDFDLCVECFSVGVEIGTHKKEHSYQVMEQLNFPIFAEDWGADEELLLLEAIDMYGIGNWVDCADHVGTKTKDDCETHYFTIYFESPTAPLPDLTKNFPGIFLKREKREEKEKPAKGDKREDKDKKFVITPSQPITNPETAGWMSLRKEFETEYNNEAEYLLAEMAFAEDDTETIRELKTRMLEIYYYRLEERYAKRKFVVDNGLLEHKKIQSELKKRPKEDRETTVANNVFMQMLPAQEFKSYIDGLLEENATRRRIEELKHYRSMGIRTFADVEQYEAERKKKDVDRPKGGYSTIARTRSLTKEKEESGKQQTPVKVQRKIDTAAGFELLSRRERELCSSLKLYPQQYVIIKDTLIRESQRHGSVKKATAKAMVKLDQAKTSRIFDFLEQNGWIVSGDKKAAEAAAAPPAPGSTSSLASSPMPPANNSLFTPMQIASMTIDTHIASAVPGPTS